MWLRGGGEGGRGGKGSEGARVQQEAEAERKGKGANSGGRGDAIGQRSDGRNRLHRRAMGAEASGGVERTCKGAADAEQNDVLGFFSPLRTCTF